MHINTRHLLCALKIKECGTLSQAANQIHLTQSALTQGINKLESDLGYTLFSRSHAGMQVTEVGELFLQRIGRAFEHLQEFVAIVFANDKAKRQAFIRSVTSRQLTALMHIVELQSYTTAAQHLGLSQPTLHRTIKDLEQFCEQPLLPRSPTGVEPTWRAKQLRRYASLFFTELQQGIDEMQEFNGQVNGSLRIGSLPLARSEIVPLAVLQLNDEFPDATISIVDGPYGEQFNSLLHGQLDLIVGALRSPNPDTVQRPMFQDQLSIVVKAKHPLATRQIISAAELQQLDWVAPAKSTPARHVFSQIFVSRGLAPPSHVIECSSLVAVRGILLNSERAALLPARQVEVEVRAGLLAVCPMTLPDTDREIGLTMRRTWHPTQMQNRFLDIIQQLVKTNSALC
ncbi:LysR family transcriptional regulator [Paraglaciecola hydrolytica]|uniref:LysR family transcriptional regulator n=1 Tax=Paraglaciecola hydrolytica TaxID=1799789 RepID=A0A148KK67_9ALTE|nr:LysR family transcriptional regulator [Paraglaciecola hydrolytica]KXI26712.1 LysR family transcriptional regulator [Paraglaciecola hydrolytica]